MDKSLEDLVAANLKHDAYLVGRVPIIAEIANAVVDALRSHRMVFVMGGEGRAHLAHHIAREFMAKFGRQSRRLPVMALTGASNMLGLVGNDYGEGDVLARQAETFIAEGDVAIGLALWEKETDLAQAMAAAVENKAHTILIIGKKGGVLKRMVDVCVSIPTNSAARVEECHLAIGHALYDVVDQTLTTAAKRTASEKLTKFGCRKCGAVMVVSARFAGRKGVCPHCTTVNLVPSHLLSEKAVEDTAPMEKREHVRFAVRDANVEILGDRAKAFIGVPINLVNMSAQGCMIRIVRGDSDAAAQAPSLTLGDRVPAHIHCPAFPQPISATGEVVRALRDDEEQIEDIGLRFLTFEEGSAEKIQKLESDRVLRNVPAFEKSGR